jgi:hypothetical protein
MKSTGFVPRARTERLAVEHLLDETVVYDLDATKAYCLNPFASRLWEASDGQNTVSDIQTSTCASEAEVLHGLQLLGASGLLIEPLPLLLNRRRALRRLGGTVALAAVSLILVPSPAAAASCRPLGAVCGDSTMCCSGCCKRSGVAANTCINGSGGSCI